MPRGFFIFFLSPYHAHAVPTAWDALSSTSYFLLTFQDSAPSGIFPEPPATVGEQRSLSGVLSMGTFL